MHDRIDVDKLNIGREKPVANTIAIADDSCTITSGIILSNEDTT